MTLNDFYATKLESLFKLIDNMDAVNAKGNSAEIEKIEKIGKTKFISSYHIHCQSLHFNIVKDNEVRIPYDEDIFIGIDKNYKILKKILNKITKLS